MLLHARALTQALLITLPGAHEFAIIAAFTFIDTRAAIGAASDVVSPPPWRYYCYFTLECALLLPPACQWQPRHTSQYYCIFPDFDSPFS